MPWDIMKHEMTLSLNNFQKQELLDLNHSIARIILNIFLLRRGNIPGLPHIGVNIREYLYKSPEEFDSQNLKNLALAQCSELLPGFITGNIDIYFIADLNGQPLIIISVGIADMTESNLINFGFTLSGATGDLQSFYDFEKEQLKSITTGGQF
jgi:hypothetical protein